MLSICSTVHDDTHCLIPMRRPDWPQTPKPSAGIGELSLTSGSNLENLSLGVDSRIPFLFISVSIPIFPPSSSAQHPSRPIFLSLSFSSFSTLLNHRYPRQSCCSSINSNRSSRDAQELLTRARSLAHPPLVPRSSSRRDAFSTPSTPTNPGDDWHIHLYPLLHLRIRLASRCRDLHRPGVHQEDPKCHERKRTPGAYRRLCNWREGWTASR